MEDYIELEEIGRGSYGTVFKCKHRATGEIVAIKQMRDEDGNEQMRKTAIREAKLLKQLQHPNVVRLMELFRSKTRLYMVFEFMDRSILKLLESNSRGLHPLEVKKILWQLVLALNFLHGQQIIHRDLKPENILTTDSGTVKLADFGFARPQAHGGHNLSPYVATRWYRAPELLVGDTYGPGVDVWAMGCLLVELATGQPLFPGKSNMDQLWLIVRCVGCTPRQMSRMRSNATLSKMTMPQEEELIPLEKRYAYFDRATMALLKACLDPEPQKRPTAVQLMTHEYFTSPQAQKVLAAYTAAASQAVAGVKIGGGKAPGKASTDVDLPEKTIKLSDHAHHHNHHGQQHGKPAAPPPQPRPGAMSARPKLPGTAVPPPHSPMNTKADTGLGKPKEGGSAAGSDLDVPRGYTGSDDGAAAAAADAPDDDEYEAEPEEYMSAESRARVQRWVDAIPEPKKGGDVKTVLSVLPGGGNNYGGMSPGMTGGMSPGMTGGVPPGMTGGMSPGITGCVSPGIMQGGTGDAGGTLLGGMQNGSQSPVRNGWLQGNVGTLPTTGTMGAGMRPTTATGAAASILSTMLNNNNNSNNQGLGTPPAPIATNTAVPGAHSPISGPTTPSILNNLVHTPGVLTSEPPTLTQLQQNKGTPGQGVQGMLLPFPGDSNGTPAIHIRATHGPVLPPRNGQRHNNNTQDEPETLEQMILRQMGGLNSPQTPQQPQQVPQPAISADGTPPVPGKTLERFASLRQSASRSRMDRLSSNGAAPSPLPETPPRPIINQTSSPGGASQLASPAQVTVGGRTVRMSTDGGRSSAAASTPGRQPMPPDTPAPAAAQTPTPPPLPATSSTADRTSTSSARRLALLTVANPSIAPASPAKITQTLSPGTVPPTPATAASASTTLFSPQACPSPILTASENSPSPTASGTGTGNGTGTTPGANSSGPLDALIKSHRANLGPSPTPPAAGEKDSRSPLQILIDQQEQHNARTHSLASSLPGSIGAPSPGGALVPHPPTTPASVSNDPMAALLRFASNNGNDRAKPSMMRSEDGTGTSQQGDGQAPTYISLLESLASGSRKHDTGTKGRTSLQQVSILQSVASDAVT